MYRLIDTDTDEVIATAETAAEVLAATPYLPSDVPLRVDSGGVVEWAETWEDVVDAVAQHADGFAGILDGYRVEWDS